MGRASVVLLALALLPACRRASPPPAVQVENALVVTSAAAPALPEAEDDEPASMILREGEVLLPQRHLPRLKWVGAVLGAQVTRDAEMLEAQLAPQGTYVYVFTSDLAERSVPTTAHFCANAPKEAPFVLPCAAVLRRYVFGNDEAVGFHLCGVGPCGVAFAKGAKVTWRSVEGLAELYPANLGGINVLIATSHFQRSLAETGRKVRVFAVEPALPELGELLLDEIDSRTDVVLSRSGAVTVRPYGLELVGVRREVDKTTGKERSTSPIRESWGVGADRKLTRR